MKRSYRRTPVGIVESPPGLPTSPWIVGFAAITFAMWVHVVLGLLVAAAAAWELWAVRHQPPATA
jgi:hypothetical protein